MPTLNQNSGVTILIAEDDDGHAQLICDLIVETGIKNPVIRFRDGEEVIEFLGKPDLAPVRSCVLLLDIRMPRMDGIEVLRHMKADPRLKSIPVIMLTTTDDPREIQGCYDLGCNCYVTKPLEFDRFVSALRQLGLFLLLIQLPLISQQAPPP
jgi:CheY-like chemotaxis protein